MSRFEIGQIDEVPFASDSPLHRDEIGQGADWGLNTVDATSLGTLHKVCKGQGGGSLREKIELTMRGGQVDRPISSNPTLGDR